MPLVSYRNALFMKNEIPGISVPDGIIDRYDRDMSREEAQRVGVEIAVEIAEKLPRYHRRILFHGALNRAAMIAQILEKCADHAEIEKTGTSFTEHFPVYWRRTKNHRQENKDEV